MKNIPQRVCPISSWLPWAAAAVDVVVRKVVAEEAEEADGAGEAAVEQVSPRATAPSL